MDLILEITRKNVHIRMSDTLSEVAYLFGYSVIHGYLIRRSNDCHEIVTKSHDF